MATKFPRGNLFGATLATTAETEILTVAATQFFKAGVVCYITSSVTPGILTVYYVDQDGTDWEITTADVTAGVLTVLEVDYPIPLAKFTFTPNNATPSVVKAEVLCK